MRKTFKITNLRFEPHLSEAIELSAKTFDNVHSAVISINALLSSANYSNILLIR